MCLQGSQAGYLLTAMGRQVDLTPGLLPYTLVAPGSREGPGLPTRPILHLVREGRTFYKQEVPSGSPAEGCSSQHWVSTHNPLVSQTRSQRGSVASPWVQVPRPHQLIQVKTTLTPYSEASGLPAPVPRDSPRPTLPARNRAPALPCPPWTDLFSVPSNTSYRAAGNSWCIAQGTLPRRHCI